MKKNNVGMTLLELMIGVIVALAMLMAIGIRTRGVIQRAKISASKAAINTLALALSTVRADTGFYPNLLEDLKSTVSPPYLNIPARFWKGPYLTQGVSLIDPWGEPYFYELAKIEEDPETIFGPYIFERTAGPPYDETFSFDAGNGRGRIVIINEDEAVTAGWIWLNDVLVVSPDEFTKFSPEVVNEVDLLEGGNTIRIRLASGPGWTINLRVDFIGGGTDDSMRTGTFILGSYGRDNEPGGEGFDTDIVHGEFR